MKNIFIKLHFLSIILLTLISTCCSSNESIPIEKTNNASVNKFYQYTGIELPNLATVLYLKKTSESDSLLRAKVNMPINSFESWITRFYLKMDSFEPEKKYLLGPSFDDWNIEQYPQIPTSQVSFEDAKVLNIGFVKLDDESVQLFLVYHGL